LGGAYIGTNFAILQSLAPVEMRAVMAAINLFILNIVGLGLGPVGVGFISDLAAPEHGIESIRYGLLATLVVMAWGALHQARVGFLLHRNDVSATI
jgi:MFS family permease